MKQTPKETGLQLVLDPMLRVNGIPQKKLADIRPDEKGPIQIIFDWDAVGQQNNESEQKVRNGKRSAA